jgi:hydroxymethylglutaryl-CoA reductase
MREQLKYHSLRQVDAILDAWAFAEADQFRATTHNKGIMNGAA